MDEVEYGGLEDRKPTPVRAAMEGSEVAEGDEVGLDRPFTEPKTGEGWIAKVSGRSNSGVLPLRVIPLMEVSFCRAESPCAPVFRAICQGETLEELDDAGLLSLFRTAGPFESVEGKGAPSRRDEGRLRGRRGPSG